MILNSAGLTLHLINVRSLEYRLWLGALTHFTQMPLDTISDVISSDNTGDSGVDETLKS